MAIILSIIRLKLIVVLIVIPIIGVAQTSTYSFTSPELIPNQKIKDLLDKNIELCFDNTDISTRELQQHIQFYTINDSLKVSLVTSPKVILDTKVDWGLLNIKGVFKYRNRLVIVEVDENTEKVYKSFFRKKSKAVKSVIDLNVNAEPSCITLYFLENKNFIFLHKTFMF
ncbi:hypothetical protein [Aequorivita echinoideorum]|uniref:Uncharacterized protein n=1 Tax=Aequorivita echinoideorum TaxID=1549647 RepID=A0ABS5S573_9FLAO|nr:hypothetical protein [Aequorivita echinoideorum]MBT0607559.1 hypothetical protein [Aequorivita echinoideorum]